MSWILLGCIGKFLRGMTEYQNIGREFFGTDEKKKKTVTYRVQVTYGKRFWNIRWQIH